jgi:cytochrome c peroxidase
MTDTKTATRAGRGGRGMAAAGLVAAALAAGAGCDQAMTDDATEGVTEAASTSSVTSDDPFGQVKVMSTDAGGINRGNPFFKSFGTNGRRCDSCHKLENAMGLSVPTIEKIFNQTAGLDPLFRVNDGSNAPTGLYANVSTEADRRQSFSMLLRHGVIRVGEPMPAKADFTLAAIQDPYRFASPEELSLFRRPIPSVNVAFGTLVMWDGRESEEGRTGVRDALINQANDATLGHAQAAKPLTMAQREAIADFQLKLFAAQSRSTAVGALDAAGCKTNDAGEPCEEARGGPQEIIDALRMGTPGSEEQGTFNRFAIGINDSFVEGFRNISFTPFEPWESDNFPAADKSAVTKTRGDIGDGENLFYTKPINITGVAGLNDVLRQPVVKGFCTTCHNTPDVGTHSRARFFAIGIAGVQGNPLFSSEFPIYTFRSSDGAQISLSDPGLALRTGKFSDLGRFKVPALRGLGSRAPYFHNGQAKTLNDVVNFYNQRFQIGFTADEIRKVVLFLQQT